jgi:hypothetical protein
VARAEDQILSDAKIRRADPRRAHLRERNVQLTLELLVRISALYRDRLGRHRIDLYLLTKRLHERNARVAAIIRCGGLSSSPARATRHRGMRGLQVDTTTHVVLAEVIKRVESACAGRTPLGAVLFRLILVVLVRCGFVFDNLHRRFDRLVKPAREFGFVDGQDGALQCFRLGEPLPARQEEVRDGLLESHERVHHLVRLLELCVERVRRVGRFLEVVEQNREEDVQHDVVANQIPARWDGFQPRVRADRPREEALSHGHHEERADHWRNLHGVEQRFVPILSRDNDEHREERVREIVKVGARLARRAVLEPVLLRELSSEELHATERVNESEKQQQAAKVEKSGA